VGVPPAPPRDLYVVSDLHLGRGLRPDTRRWSRLEAFLYDEDFLAFCRWLCRDARGRAALVLNGDIFDFLRIESEPAPGARGTERRFGPPPTPEVAARLVTDILIGHPRVLDGLCDVLAAGHEVVVLPGNHDLENQSDEVRAVVRGAVEDRLAAMQAPEGAAGRLSFESWFVYEPGRVWIEHGCQYDPENAFRYHLRRGLNRRAASAAAEGDLPLGNFFQRYLYNAFGSITFIVPSSRANYRYFRWLLANEPRLLLQVTFSQARFVVQLLRRLARLPVAGWREEAALAQAAELTELGARSGLGGTLLEVDGLKATGADAVQAASAMLRQMVKLVAGAIGMAVLALAVLTASSAAIGALEAGVGWKALFSLLVYLTFAATAAVGLVAAALRMPRDRPPHHLSDAAARLSGLLDVPLVVFGHTHEEVVEPLARPTGQGWYFNTGTWIAVFTHDVLVPRERVQFTFLRVRGADAELLHFSPGRNGALPVVLLEEEEPQDAPGPVEAAREVATSGGPRQRLR
jgi:UDP-2,3-diacylglucosamine pyrophosphatase LpxH